MRYSAVHFDPSGCIPNQRCYYYYYYTTTTTTTTTTTLLDGRFNRTEDRVGQHVASGGWQCYARRSSSRPSRM